MDALPIKDSSGTKLIREAWERRSILFLVFGYWIFIIAITIFLITGENNFPFNKLLQTQELLLWLVVDIKICSYIFTPLHIGGLLYFYRQKGLHYFAILGGNLIAICWFTPILKQIIISIIILFFMCELDWACAVAFHVFPF